MTDKAKDWKPSTPGQCDSDLYDKIRKAQTADKNELKLYIEDKFNQIAPAWKMAVDNRTLIIGIMVFMIIGFAFMIPMVM